MFWSFKFITTLHSLIQPAVFIYSHIRLQQIINFIELDTTSCPYMINNNDISIKFSIKIELHFVIRWDHTERARLTMVCWFQSQKRNWFDKLLLHLRFSLLTIENLIMKQSACRWTVIVGCETHLVFNTCAFEKNKIIALALTK